METIIEEHGKVAIVTLKGRLETTESADVQEKITTLYEKDLERVVIECKDLEYIASSGLRILLSILKQAKSHDCNLVLRNVNDDIKDVFRMTGFINIFQFE
jgi:anti-anti-sigma factor